MRNSFHIGPFRIAPHVRDGIRTEKWCVDIPKALLGKRQRKFFDRRSQAEEYAKKLDRKYRAGEWGRFRQATASPARLRLKDAIERWVEFQETRVQTKKKRPISLSTDRMRLKGALAFFGNVELSALTEEKLARFQAHRLNFEKRKPATIKSDLIALGKVLRWGLKNGFITRLPEIEHVPENRHDTTIPTKEEVARLIAALPPNRRLLVRFLAETGCRSGEAFNLTWDCVDLITGAVEIRPKDGWTPKTRSSQRRIYIGGPLLEALKGLSPEGPYVFPGHSPDKPLTNIKRAFATAVKATKVERDGKLLRVTPHTLRKAFATWLAVDDKVPQCILQSILGHTPGSRVTDQYYVMPQDQAKREAVITLPVVEEEQTKKNSTRPSGNTVATGRAA